MKHQIFNLEGRRAYVNLFREPYSDHALFMWGNSANAYDRVEGRAVWVHGTLGDLEYSGINGKYYEIAIDRWKALRNPYPTIEIVGKPKIHTSRESLLSSRNWVLGLDAKPKLHTYCNLNVSFCRSMAYGSPGIQYARWGKPIEKEWVANQIWNELIAASQQPSDGIIDSRSWIRLDHKTAQHIANLGGFVLACSYNAIGYGHLVFLIEDPSFEVKTYDPYTTEGLDECLRLKCFHCGQGKPGNTELGNVFASLTSPATAISLLDSVRLYCDRKTWDEFSCDDKLESARQMSR